MSGISSRVSGVKGDIVIMKLEISGVVVTNDAAMV